MTELEALIALNSINGIGPGALKKIKESLGSFAAAFDKRRTLELPKAGVRASAIEELKSFSAKWLKNELRLVKKHNVRIIAIGDKEYPKILAKIPNPPYVLYVSGNLNIHDIASIAIVGSRRASIYGINCAQKFARQLACAGLAVTSGLARGIDAASHRGALVYKGLTIAVLGSGLARLYPAEHKKLADEIRASGALVSEYSMECPPYSGNFPKRNRIISGLALCVLVIEAAKRSGSLITAQCAAGQQKKVFAVPGGVDSISSTGTNKLIKEGACLVQDPQDILEEINWPNAGVKKTKKTEEIFLQDIEDKDIYKNILSGGISIDALLNKTGMSVQDLSSRLTKMELTGRIRQLPGKIFIRR